MLVKTRSSIFSNLVFSVATCSDYIVVRLVNESGNIVFGVTKFHELVVRLPAFVILVPIRENEVPALRLHCTPPSIQTACNVYTQTTIGPSGSV